MRSLLAGAASALLLLATPALAQRSGTYAVEGRSPGGASYEGALTLEATGPSTWKITWRIGGNTTTGTAISMGTTLVTGYSASSGPGVAVYELQPDGRMTGRWTQGPNGGVGTETLLPR